MEDGFEGDDMDIDDDRFAEIVEEFNIDAKTLGQPIQTIEQYDDRRLECMKGMVLLLSALSILPPEI